jgi:hypothetical protein
MAIKENLMETEVELSSLTQQVDGRIKNNANFIITEIGSLTGKKRLQDLFKFMSLYTSLLEFMNQGLKNSQFTSVQF